jgi:hypothetical protein
METRRMLRENADIPEDVTPQSKPLLIEPSAEHRGEFVDTEQVNGVDGGALPLDQSTTYTDRPRAGRRARRERGGGGGVVMQSNADFHGLDVGSDE